MSPESWAGLSFLKVRRKPETGFRSNEAAWTDCNVSAFMVLLPFALAAGDTTSLQAGITKRDPPYNIKK